MIEPQIQSQVASDGYQIHVTAWPTEGTPKARVVILHGIQSHAGWYNRLGRNLAAAGYETYFPDRRGSGANRVDRGHVDAPSRLIADQTEWLGAIRAQIPETPVVLAGISWGGKLALAVAAKRPELADALALICPGVCSRIHVPALERIRIALAYLFRRRRTFPIPLSDPALFTANPDGQAFIGSDPLSLRAGTAGLLATSAILDRIVSRVPRKIQQPTLLMLAGEDRIVDNDRTRNYFQKLASQRKEIVDYPSGHHTLEFESDPDRYALDLIAWLDANVTSKRSGESA